MKQHSSKNECEKTWKKYETLVGITFKWSDINQHKRFHMPLLYAKRKMSYWNNRLWKILALLYPYIGSKNWSAFAKTGQENQFTVTWNSTKNWNDQRTKLVNWLFCVQILQNQEAIETSLFAKRLSIESSTKEISVL